tara:strand:+ start:116 stop:511 length:396 start_codon:yes stop_codon:yes gene_type:complete
MANEDKFVPGELVFILVEGLNYSADGFAMGGFSDDGKCEMKLYETIDMYSYPSCNDFKGKDYMVHHGDIALISKYVGRPLQIKHDPAWFKYDIYEIILGERTVQAFRQNLRKVTEGLPSFPEYLDCDNKHA